MAVQSQTEAGFTKRDTCRGCDSPNLLSVLDLGHQPLANGFLKPDRRSDGGEWVVAGDAYPLHLVRCLDCELLQLTVVVDPTILYGRHYKYRSGYSEGWDFHCHDLAKDIKKMVKDSETKRVLEIGCLDGVLLRHCSANGCDVMGVDPSSPVTTVPIIREFWHPDITLPRPLYDVIVAQNVFGHVDDAKGFLRGVRRYLATGGTCIIECPWVVAMVDGVQWDQVYHEHLSYWGLRSMMRVAQVERLVVTDVRYFPELHGGTMRYYLAHPNKHKNVRLYDKYRDEEMGDDDWKRFSRRAADQVAEWEVLFSVWEGERKSVAAYGASAKLNVFLNALQFRPHLDYILDDNPTKHGLLSPGWYIPVVAPTRERMQDLDVLLIGAANWKADIEAKAKALGFTGEIVALWQ